MTFGQQKNIQHPILMISFWNYYLKIDYKTRIEVRTWPHNDDEFFGSFFAEKNEQGKS